MNEYLAIYSGGHVSDLVFARNEASLECFPEKPSWCRNEQVCQGGQKCKALFGPDIALYKNYLYLFLFFLFGIMYIISFIGPVPIVTYLSWRNGGLVSSCVYLIFDNCI